MGVVLLILKILLYIILAVLGIIVIVLIIPVGGEVSYIDGKLSYKVKASLLNVMDSDGGGVLGWLKKRKKKPKKEKKNKKDSDDSESEITEDDFVSEDENVSESNDIDPQDIPVADEKPSEEKEAEQETAEPVSETKPAEDKKTGKSSETEEVEWEYDDDESEDDEDSEKAEDKKPITDKIEKLLTIWEIAQRPALKIFKGFHFKDVYIDFIIADEDAYKCAISYGRMCAVIYNALGQMGRLFDLRLKTVDIHPGFSLSKGRTDAALKLDFRLGTVVISGVWFLITYIFKIFIPDKLKKRKLKKSAAKQK